MANSFFHRIGDGTERRESKSASLAENIFCAKDMDATLKSPKRSHCQFLFAFISFLNDIKTNNRIYDRLNMWFRFPSLALERLRSSLSSARSPSLSLSLYLSRLAFFLYDTFSV